jgi:hypothetical protein
MLTDSGTCSSAIGVVSEASLFSPLPGLNCSPGGGLPAGCLAETHSMYHAVLGNVNKNEMP